MTTQAEYIKNETLADRLINKIEADVYQKTWSINGKKVVIGISKH